MASQRTVGTAMPMPPWWLDELRKAFEEAKWTQPKLAAALTELLGRKPAYDHKAVARFMSGEITTKEMMEGMLCLFPSLPQPVFIAHDRDEAQQMANVVRRVRSAPEWQKRYGSLAKQVTEKRESVQDQTETLPSENESKARRQRKDSGRLGRLG